MTADARDRMPDAIRDNTLPLRDALRRIRDYSTPAHSNYTTTQLLMDAIFKAADDALTGCNCAR